MYKVFDIHTHTYPEQIAEKACISLGNFYNFDVLGKGTYAHLESQAEANNVKGYLLFSVATNAHQVPKVNSSIAALAELSRSHGFKTVGFAGMHQDFEDFEVSDLGVDSVRAYYSYGIFYVLMREDNRVVHAVVNFNGEAQRNEWILWARAMAEKLK